MQRVYNIINLAGPLAITNTTVTNEQCGNSQGAINLTVSGTGLTYLWNTNATTEDLSGLQAGTYICTITNSSGCTLVSNSIHVFDAPGTIEVSTQTIVHEVCGNGNGSIDSNKLYHDKGISVNGRFVISNNHDNPHPPPKYNN